MMDESVISGRLLYGPMAASVDWENPWMNVPWKFVVCDISYKA
jgi:hypothetical protein